MLRSATRVVAGGAVRRFITDIGRQKLIPVANGLHEDEDSVQRQRHDASKYQLRSRERRSGGSDVV